MKIVLHIVHISFRCTGLSDVDLKFGTCWNDDPCASGVHSCRPNERCVPARQVCLSMLKKYCVQYKCGKTLFFTRDNFLFL